MKKLLAATLLAASFATPALSADMAVKAAPIVVSPAYDWSGFYFGGAVGGEWTGFDRFYYNQAPTVGIEQSKSGVNYAGILGVQKQFGMWVVGIEGAWNNNINNINTINPSVILNGGTTSTSSKITDILTVGARVGYAGWNNWLLYGTAGYATARISAEYFTTATGAPFAMQEWGTARVSGWYAGAGVDYLAYKGVAADIIVGAEYQHIDVSHTATMIQPLQGPAFINNYTFNADPIDIVRARLTVKFNPWGSTAVVAKY